MKRYSLIIAAIGIASAIYIVREHSVEKIEPISITFSSYIVQVVSWSPLSISDFRATQEAGIRDPALLICYRFLTYNSSLGRDKLFEPGEAVSLSSSDFENVLKIRGISKVSVIGKYDITINKERFAVFRLDHVEPDFFGRDALFIKKAPDAWYVSSQRQNEVHEQARKFFTLIKPPILNRLMENTTATSPIIDEAKSTDLPLDINSLRKIVLVDKNIIDGAKMLDVVSRLYGQTDKKYHAFAEEIAFEKMFLKPPSAPK